MSSTTTDSGDFYFMEYHTAMLVTEAEKLYNKLVKDLVNRAIDDAACLVLFCNSSFSLLVIFSLFIIVIHITKYGYMAISSMCKIINPLTYS
jgi:hypothetical protein